MPRLVNAALTKAEFESLKKNGKDDANMNKSKRLVDSGVRPYSFFYYNLGNMIYVGDSILYVFTDHFVGDDEYSSNYNWIYWSLSFTNIIGAIFYYLAWNGIKVGEGMSITDLRAEYSNLISAVYYFIVLVVIYTANNNSGAEINIENNNSSNIYNNSTDDSSDDALTTTMVGLTPLFLIVFSNILFMIEASYYAVAWVEWSEANPSPGRGFSLEGLRGWDVYLWANALNVLAALLYLVDSAGAIYLFDSNPVKSANRWIETSPKVWGGGIYKYADYVYLVDSLLYVLALRRDEADAAKAMSENSEETQSGKLDPCKQGTIELGEQSSDAGSKI